MCVSDRALGEEPRLQQPVAVVHQRFDRERPRRLVDRRADVGDLALERLAGNASTTNSTVWPALITLAYFSWTPVRSFSGFIWTIVATGVFSRMNSPGWTRRSETEPATGARIAASSSFFCASSYAARRSCRLAFRLRTLSTAAW